MVQPTFNDTDFVALNNHVFDVKIVTQVAGNFTFHSDGGPYTGSGPNPGQIRNDLKTSIDAGSHINWTAVNEGTDAIRIASLGPGQHIGGGPQFINPAVAAPAGGAISLTDVTPFEGIDFVALQQAIEADVLILTKLRIFRPIEYVTLDAQPRVLRINFLVDPLPGAEKTALDALVAAFTDAETESIFAQLARTAGQVPVFATLFGANIGIVSKGPPDGGFKIFDFTPVVSSAITGLRARRNVADGSELIIDVGSCVSESKDVAIAITSPLTIDIDVVLAGGLDTGTKANDTWYAVYIIAKDDGTTDGLFSLVYEPTGPLMPSGFTQRRYIGDALITSGGEITDFRIYGDGRDISYVWSSSRLVSPFRVLDSGAAEAFADIDLSGVVPVTANKVRYVMTNQNSPIAYVRERDAAGGITQPWGTVRITGVTTSNNEMGVDSDLKIQYCMSTSGGSLHVDVVGYEVHR